MSNNPSEIAARLREYFRVEAPAHGELADDSPLLESGILDSLAVVKLITHLEEAFGVAITDDEFDPDNFENIGAIAKLIASKQGG